MCVVVCVCILLYVPPYIQCSACVHTVFLLNLEQSSHQDTLPLPYNLLTHPSLPCALYLCCVSMCAMTSLHVGSGMKKADVELLVADRKHQRLLKQLKETEDMLLEQLSLGRNYQSGNRDTVRRFVTGGLRTVAGGLQHCSPGSSHNPTSLPVHASWVGSLHLTQVR